MTGPMRIAIVETAPYGGLLHYAVQLGEALATRGNEVDLLTSSGNELVDRVHTARMRAVLTPPVRSERPPTRRILAEARRAVIAGRLARAWARVNWEVARNRYDAVIINSSLHASLMVAGSLGLFLPPSRPRVAYIAHSPRVQLRHGGEDKLYGESPLLARLLRQLYTRCDVVFVLGESSLAQLLAQWPQSRGVVIPHGDERVFGGEPPPPSAEQRILFFGDWTRMKGIPVLMAAFDELVVRRSTVRLTIAGTPHQTGMDLEGIRGWAREHGDRVELIDEYVPLDDVPSVFAAARVVATPYIAANQSGVVHLAMTMARAVVASDVGDLASVVISGETGLVVPPSDPSALADALERIVSDGELAARFGEAGRARVLEHAGWDVVAAKVEASLRQHVKVSA
jgi:glycosyltransferase involved in cell wall biosynthesis